MDQKETEGKMLALTDGEVEAVRVNSSYVMVPTAFRPKSDRKAGSDRDAIAETRRSAGKTENGIAEAQKYFDDKGSWGLWWDAKGIFNSSNKEDVVQHMEKHKKFYNAVVTFTVMVEAGDTKSYKSLLDLYEELSVLEDEAKSDAESHESKAICRMLREFLDEKFKLDHNLKRVECVVLKQKIDDVEKSCERSREAVDQIGDGMNRILEENREIKQCLKESQDQAKELKVQNEMCMKLVERISEEKDELKGAMERKMEELSLEADRRAEEANRRSDARIQKMAEQTQREMQKISQMLASMKNYNFP